MVMKSENQSNEKMKNQGTSMIQFREMSQKSDEKINEF